MRQTVQKNILGFTTDEMNEKFAWDDLSDSEKEQVNESMNKIMAFVMEAIENLGAYQVIAPKPIGADQPKLGFDVVQINYKNASKEEREAFINKINSTLTSGEKRMFTYILSLSEGVSYVESGM